MSKEVNLTVRIKPAFTVEIVNDSTGRSWSGHRTYGNTAKEALIRWRTGLGTLPEYQDTKITFRAEEPKLARAVTWKEPVIDDE